MKQEVEMKISSRVAWEKNGVSELNVRTNDT